MNKSLIGSVFILISSIFFSARYLAASVAFINYTESSEIFFRQILDDTFILLELSIVSLAIGLIILLIDYIKPIIKKA